MTSWEERMGAKAKARQNAELEEQFAELRTREPWRFDIDHPDNADVCRDCTVFRLFNPAAPWLGSGWNVTCGSPCKFDHDHHDNEIWYASQAS